MSLLLPDTVIHGRYRIAQLIGQGGFGSVYEALDTRLDRRVALKQLLHVNDKISRQFEREARLLANLEHPALPRVTDHFPDPAGQFLVMDYIAGADLAELLDQRGAPFPVDQVLTWADQLLDALDYLHTHDPPIIHRDIKPQNLKLRSRGGIVLLDFGLAKGHAGEVPATTTRSILAYTRGYAPPEQVRGIGTEPRSDLYSLGATLHTLLTNMLPIEAGMRSLDVAEGLPDPLRPAHELNPDVPEGLSQVLQQALALQIGARPVSASAMRVSLQSAWSGATASDTTTDGGVKEPVLPPREVVTAVPVQGKQTPGMPLESRRRGRRWRWVAVASVVAVSVILVVLTLRLRRADDGIDVATGAATPTETLSPAATSTATAVIDAVVRVRFPSGGEEYVSRAEFEQARDKLGLQQAPEQFILDFLATRHLLLHDARLKSVNADPKLVEQFFNRIKTQTCPQAPIPEAQTEKDPDKLVEACANYFGFEDSAAMRRYLQEQVVIDQLIDREVPETATAQPTAMAENLEETHSQHILVETEEQARKAYLRVTTGKEDFGKVAEEISTDPSAKQNNGDLGFTRPGQLVPEFEQAAATLRPGEISQPVQTQFGWHVIKVLERRKASSEAIQQAQPQAAQTQQAQQEVGRQQAEEAYRNQVLEKAKKEGRVQYLITPKPAPTQGVQPGTLPTVEVLP